MQKHNKYKGKSNELFVSKQHVQRIAELINHQQPYFPEFLEVFTANPCNHHCTFCISADYRTEKKFLPEAVFYKAIEDAARGGTPKLRFCGGGEPLLHPRIHEFISFAAQHIDSVNLITNASMMKEETAAVIAAKCNEVRISLDAGDAPTYAAVHGTAEKNFATTLENIRQLILLRGTATAPFVELSFVAMQQNIHSLQSLIDIANAIGVDRLNITANTFQPAAEQTFILQQVENIVQANAGSNVQLYYHESPQDLFSSTSLPCPAFLLYGVITAEGDYYSSCHHVGQKQQLLGTLSSELSLPGLLSRPAVIEQQLQYAFGTGVKCDKLTTNPYNFILMHGIMQEAPVRDAVTTWMSRQIKKRPLIAQRSLLDKGGNG